MDKQADEVVAALRQATILAKQMFRYWTPPDEGHRKKTLRRIEKLEKTLAKCAQNDVPIGPAERQETHMPPSFRA